MQLLAPTTGLSQPPPLKTFRPLPWQVEPWRDTSGTILLTGSAGGGKSHLAMEKINGFCLRYPGAFALLIRKVKVSMTSGAALFFEDEVALSKLDSQLTGARHLPSKSRFEYRNGSMVAYIGLEDKKQLQRLRSIGRRGGVDIAFMEEAVEFAETDYNAVLARLRGTAATWRQIILATNPDAPTHWINTRLIQGGGAKIYYSAAVNNPHNPADYLETLEGLTGVDKLRLADGKWVQATGLIYDTWSDGPVGGNVTEEADYIPGGGPIFWGVDDGYTGQIDPISRTFTAKSHPRVFGLYQMRANGQLCRFEEVYRVKTQDTDHVQEVLDLGYPLPEVAVVDKSAASLYGLLLSGGKVQPIRAKCNVDEGIKNMRRWVAADKYGFRRLLVHPRCFHYRQEMVSYRYEDGSEKPRKEFDHGPDETRYLTWHLRYE